MVSLFFSGIDAIFAIFFCFVALGISIYSYKVYTLSSLRNAKFFSIGFFMLAIAYFIWAVIDIFVLSGTLKNLNYLLTISPLTESFIALMAFITSYVLGLSTLAYTVVKVHKRSLFILIFSLSFLGIGLSSDITLSFFLITSIIFVFLSASYLKEYMLKKNIYTLTTFVAFLFLTLANIQFLFSTLNSWFYITGHLSAFIGYLLIFISLATIIKNGRQKEKQTRNNEGHS